MSTIFMANFRRNLTNIKRKDIDPLSRRLIRYRKSPDLNNLKNKPKEDNIMRETLKDQYINSKLKALSFEEKVENIISKYASKPQVIYEKEEEPIGITLDDNYVILEYPKPDEKDIVSYRTKKVYSKKHKITVLLKIAILKNGKTKVTSVWYPRESKRAKELMKQYGVVEEARISAVSAAKLGAKIRKIIPKDLEEAISKAKFSLKAKVPKSARDVGATWKVLKGGR